MGESERTNSSGQAAPLMVGAALALLVAVAVLGAFGRVLLARASDQRAADLAAASAARSMRDDFSRLFEPSLYEDGRRNPLHLEKRRYLERARAAAIEIARSNGAKRAPSVTFPDGDSFAPLRVRVHLVEVASVQSGAKQKQVPLRSSAEAELLPPSSAGVDPWGGGYAGPFAHRQGKPMRPDVAVAFDRMDRAARGDGVALVITSAYRSDSEQAKLFARHPDPRWVAPPGRSLHRNGTELDLGPSSAYGWLQRNAAGFGFRRRYSWEPWH